MLNVLDSKKTCFVLYDLNFLRIIFNMLFCAISNLDRMVFEQPPPPKQQSHRIGLVEQGHSIW